MYDDKARRGRPKGSGIDDQSRLQTIAAMLAADPSLKPTTAIKSIGITDPSAIRRLRDKFHEFSAAQQKAARATAAETPTPVAISEPAMKVGAKASPAPMPAAEPRKVQAQRAIAVVGPQPARKVEPIAQPVASAPATVTTHSNAGAAADIAAPRKDTTSLATAWFTMWTGMGLQIASAAFQSQVAIGQHLVRLPPLAIALRQQLALNEMAMALCLPRGVSSPTLH